MSEPICKGCNKPMLPDEGRYTGSENADPPTYWHWDCHETWVQNLKADLADMPDRLKAFQAKINRLKGI